MRSWSGRPWRRPRAKRASVGLDRHQPLVQDRLGQLGGTAVRRTYERALLVPAVGNVVAPERPSPGVGRAPADRLVVRVSCVVVAREELDAMAVGVAQI